MEIKKNKTEEIRQILGLEELCPMKTGEIRAGANKKKEGGKAPPSDINDPLDL